VPSYSDLPMERVFPTEPVTDTPMVFCRTVGAGAGTGRVVYFPMDLDRTFWEILSPDHLSLLSNAVDWAADEPRPVRVTGAGVFDVSVWRQDRSLTVHLVNLTNPMMMKGPYREIIPTGPIRVELAVPAGVRISGVKLLESGQRVQSRRQGDTLSVEVPHIALHEIVAVDLAVPRPRSGH
jgi:hypothetical protein